MARRGSRRGLDEVPDGARWGPDEVPDGARRGAQRGQTGCWTEGLFTFKKKKRHVMYTCHVNHRQHPTCPTPGGCKKNLR
jgi:hypothetical protein